MNTLLEKFSCLECLEVLVHANKFLNLFSINYVIVLRFKHAFIFTSSHVVSFSIKNASMLDLGCS